MSRNLKMFCLAITSVLLLAASKTNAADDTAWESLREGTAIAIMRHALAPGFSDPAGFSLDDCQTQRNLSAEGQAQARSIGDLFRSKSIDSAQLYSSEWCRCLDTASLLDIGDAQALPALNSFFENRSASDDQTQALKEQMRSWLAAPAQPIVLVTHQVNISALTGAPASSGEILIITLRDDDVTVLASIPTDY